MTNEEEKVERPISLSYRSRRNRKLSLVEELAQNYEFDNCGVDSEQTSQAEIDMMVIPKSRTGSFTKNTVRNHVDIPESSTDVLLGLSEMKGEVRREIEVMNMKMTQLEQQIATILSILKSQGHLYSPRGYESPDRSIAKGRMSATSYLNDSTPPEEAPECGKNEEEPLPDWLAPTGGGSNNVSHAGETCTQAQESNSVQAANLLNESANQEAEGGDPRLIQTLNLFKKGKKKVK